MTRISPADTETQQKISALLKKWGIPTAGIRYATHVVLSPERFGFHFAMEPTANVLSPTYYDTKASRPDRYADTEAIFAKEPPPSKKLRTLQDFAGDTMHYLDSLFRRWSPPKEIQQEWKDALPIIDALREAQSEAEYLAAIRGAHSYLQSFLERWPNLEEDEQVRIRRLSEQLRNLFE